MPTHLRLFSLMAARSMCSLTPNVRANRPDAAGWLGPGWENVPRTPGRAKIARRSGSCGSAMGYAPLGTAGAKWLAPTCHEHGFET